MFRINYGNGQVSESFKSKRAALQALDAIEQYRAFAFLQKRDLDSREWMTAR